MGRFLVLVYGVGVYGAFLVTFLYAMGFVTGFVVPKTVNNGTDGPLVTSIVINTLLLGLFGLQHAVMARTAFKVRWTKIVHPAIERSTFVLATCVCLALVFWLWQPMTAIVWHVESTAATAPLHGLSAAGWLLVLYGTFLIDHFDLFGLRQVILHWRRIPYTHRPFVERALYRAVQHPLMVGFLVAFWATPTMTAGHLLFAIVTTAYILVGTMMEEHTLSGILGEQYADYRRRTPRFIPRLRRPPSAVAPAGAAEA